MSLEDKVLFFGGVVAFVLCCVNWWKTYWGARR